MKLRENRSNMVQTEVNVKSVTNCGALTDDSFLIVYKLCHICICWYGIAISIYLHFTLPYIYHYLNSLLIFTYYVVSYTQYTGHIEIIF